MVRGETSVSNRSSNPARVAETRLLTEPSDAISRASCTALYAVWDDFLISSVVGSAALICFAYDATSATPPAMSAASGAALTPSDAADRLLDGSLMSWANLGSPVIASLVSVSPATKDSSTPLATPRTSRSGQV